jgi:hypothetical protein
VAGGVEPSARRIITPVSEADVGLVHDKVIELVAETVATAVTDPGMGKVVEVTGTPVA